MQRALVRLPHARGMPAAVKNRPLKLRQAVGPIPVAQPRPGPSVGPPPPHVSQRWQLILEPLVTSLSSDLEDAYHPAERERGMLFDVVA